MNPETLQLIVNLFVACGGVGSLVLLFKARAERRKIDTDAAGVLSERALQWADRFDKSAERSEARVKEIQRELDFFEARVQQLTIRIETCLGGSPCPVRLLLINDAPAVPVEKEK